MQAAPYGLNHEGRLAVFARGFCSSHLHSFSLRMLGAVMISTLCGLQPAWAQEEDPLRYFENHVRPLLVAHCVECHGAAKQEGGLRLDSEEGLRKGGESGIAIDAEDVERSRFLQAVRYVDLEMPPKGKLPDASIEILEKWIRGGANWPTHVAPLVSRDGLREFTEEEKKYWFFQPMQLHPLPMVEIDGEAVEHPIDSFLAAKQLQVGLKPAEPASKTTLAKRLYLDLIGLPPSWDELQAYLADDREDAYERLIDRLLDDPRYGERWGRYWLDLVRYAESDGYKQDDFRPTAYRYRDYVVRSMNEDKPYGQFLTEQLAGDELDPDSVAMRDATGYLRLWIYEYNQRDVQGQWTAIMNDLTDVTGEVFLGLGYSCARCHDHKFDPLLQKDYYRLQACFAALMPRDDLPLSEGTELSEYRAKLAKWEAETEDLRRRMSELEQPLKDGTIASTIEKFPPEVRPALKKSDAERLPDEKQLAHLAFLQIKNDLKGIEFKKRLKDEALTEWEALNTELESKKKSRPKPPEFALTATDVGPMAPPVFVPGKKSLGTIEPGVPSILDASELAIPELAFPSTGRRLGLARWMADPNNRFTWRVLVNRVWQHHFGKGLVLNASDFGKLTQPPIHPELLDWLSIWTAQHQGSLKQLHRLILTSRTYRQSAYPESQQASLAIDSDNQYLWHFAPRRMDAEQIRDSMIMASGELDRRSGGNSDVDASPRRSIYRRSMRNNPDAFLRGFDGPDGSSTTPKRDNTTTSLQALLMLNSKWTQDRANQLAASIAANEPAVAQQIQTAYHRVLLRDPTIEELEAARYFLDHEGSLGDFCHVLLNSNEFLFCE